MPSKGKQILIKTKRRKYNDSNILRNKLVEVLKATKLNRAKLSKITGIKYRTLYEIQTGRGKITLDILARLRHTLGISLDNLISSRDDEIMRYTPSERYYMDIVAYILHGGMDDKIKETTKGMLEIFYAAVKKKV